LTKLQQTICLVRPATNQTYYVYLDPSTGASSSTAYSNSGSVLTSYYYYTKDHLQLGV
jgi:hypothetical protein